jgi:hypothetical protein
MRSCQKNAAAIDQRLRGRGYACTWKLESPSANQQASTDISIDPAEETFSWLFGTHFLSALNQGLA